MAKYHINPATGNPGICRADPSKPNARGCDFDLGESDHYGSAEEARAAFEQSMAQDDVPATAKPMDKKTARLQALTAIPAEQSFDRMEPFSSDEAIDAQGKLNEMLTDEQKVAEGWRMAEGRWPGDTWKEFVGKAHRARARQNELNADRYSAALRERGGKDPRSIQELVETKVVHESSERMRLTDNEMAAVEGISRLPRTTQEAVQKLPASFLRVMADAPPGNSNVKALAQLTEEIRAKDPSYVPEPGIVPPARVTGRRSEDGVPQMQKMGSYGYGLLERHAKERFGSRAKEFWGTVHSESVNYPKLSDYMRALKSFS